MESSVKIQKWIAQLGLASRREAERWILTGRVSVNGKKATVGDRMIPGKDQISVKGKSLDEKKPPLVYWVLNKPDRVLITRAKEEGRSNIYELPALKKVAFLVNPVGRLDYRTEGLLLLTNDGELSHRLMHPSYQLERRYNVVVSKRLNPEHERAEGHVILDDGPCQYRLKFVKVVKLGASWGAQYQISLCEGRNRIVRRIFEYFGVEVVRLIRKGYGPLSLPKSLEAGELLQLKSEEIKNLKRSVSLLE